MSEYQPRSSYIPSTDQVETAFHEFASELEANYTGEYEHAPEFADWREAMYGFRRWLKEEHRKAAEEAWDGCAKTATVVPAAELRENPYRRGERGDSRCT